MGTLIIVMALWILSRTSSCPCVSKKMIRGGRGGGGRRAIRARQTGVRLSQQKCGSQKMGKTQWRWEYAAVKRTGKGEDPSPVSSPSVRCSAASVAAAALAAPAPALYEVGFGAANVFVLPFYALMLAAPRWRVTRRVIASPAPFLCLGALYLVLLAGSWRADTLTLMFNNEYFMPTLTAIRTMFARGATVASAWVHLLTADLLVAVKVFNECQGTSSTTTGRGMRRGDENVDASVYPHRHSIALCMVFAPIGYAVHELTKLFCDRARRRLEARKESSGGEDVSGVGPGIDVELITSVGSSSSIDIGADGLLASSSAGSAAAAQKRGSAVTVAATPPAASNA